MLNPHKKEHDTLEKFRIKAHLRSYVKDPIVVDKRLLDTAVNKLKDLPYEEKDPSDRVAIQLVRESYILGYFTKDDLTESGVELVRFIKNQRQNRTTDSHSFKLHKTLNMLLSTA